MSEVYGPEIIPYPSEIQAGAAHIEQIGALLNAFIPSDLQWNFWYRPSVCNPAAPMCRLGWVRDSLRQFEDELQALFTLHAQSQLSDADPLHVLKLFKPATMYKVMEDGRVVTSIFCEHKPLNYDPLEFLPGDFAPHVPPPPRSTTAI